MCIVSFSFAYIEFADKDSVTTGQALDESLFRGRQIKVCCYALLIVWKKQLWSE